MKKFFSAIFMAIICIASANAEDRIYINDATCEAGQSVRVAVRMANDVEVPSWQFNMALPSEGCTVAQDPDDAEYLLVELATERTTAKKHNSFDASINKEGELVVTCASTSNKTYAVGDGDICYVTINVSKDVPAGTYALVLKNPVITEAGTNKSILPGDTSCTLTVTSYTGIQSVKASCQAKAVYNLQGTKLSKASLPGVYVVDGKKVLVK